VPVLAFAFAASYVALATGATERALSNARDAEAAVRESLRLASAVREQYNHVAHVLLLPADVEDKHLRHFRQAGEAENAAREALAVPVAGDPEAQAALLEVASGAERFRTLFRQKILPAHHRGERALALRLHVGSERLLAEMVAASDRLSAHFQALAESARADATEAGRRAVLVGLGLLGAAFALALASASWAWLSISRPLRRLAEGIEEIGSGALDARGDIDADDELGAVARCVNDMAERLKAREAALVQSERQATIGRLAAGIAHQLNNPLAVLLGYVRVLGDDRYGPEKRSEALRVLDEEVRGMQQAVRDLMDLVRPVPGAVEPCQVGELVREARARVARYVPEGGAEVRIEVDAPDTLEVLATREKVRQILVNLLKNAVEATPPGGAVRVKAREIGSQVCIDVCDQGPGIAWPARDQVFEAYFTTKRAGTGLGLALARAVARALGGDLMLKDAEATGSGPRADADADADGPGAVLRLLLPRTPSTTPQRASAPTKGAM